MLSKIRYVTSKIKKKETLKSIRNIKKSKLKTAAENLKCAYIKKLKGGKHKN